MALEWVHCNVCYAQPHPAGKSYFLSSCGHIVCDGCRNGARPPGSCPECRKEGGVTWVKLTSKLPPEVVPFFTDPRELLSKLKQTVDFQSMHQDKLLGGLRHDYLVARCVELEEEFDSLGKFCQQLESATQQRTDPQQVSMGTVAMETSDSAGSSPMSISPYPSQLAPGSQTRHTPNLQSRGSTPSFQTMERANSCRPEERPSPHCGADPHAPSLQPRPTQPPHFSRLPLPHHGQSSLHPQQATRQPSTGSKYLSQSQLLHPHTLQSHHQPSPHLMQPSPHLMHHFQPNHHPSPLNLQTGQRSSSHSLHPSQMAPSPFSIQPARRPSPHNMHTGGRPTPHSMQLVRQPSPHNVPTCRQSSPHSVQSARHHSPHDIQAHRQPSPHVMQSARHPSPHVMQSARHHSPHDIQTRRQPSPHDIQAHRQPSPHGMQSARHPSPHRMQSARHHSPHDTQTRRQPSPHDIQTRRQPSPHGIQAGRQPSPHGIQAGRQPSPHGIQTRRQPSPHGIQAGRHPSPHGIQTHRHPSPHGIQTRRHPSPHEVTTPKPSPHTKLASMLQARHSFQDSMPTPAQPTPTTHISRSPAADVPYLITLASPQGHHAYRTPLSGTRPGSVAPV